MSQREEAKTLGISASYLNEILNGKKGCDEQLMLNIKTLHPDLEFTLLNPRYILRTNQKCNYMEYRELLAKYGIEKSMIQYSLQTYDELDGFLEIIAGGKRWKQEDQERHTHYIKVMK